MLIRSIFWVFKLVSSVGIPWNLRPALVIGFRREDQWRPWSEGLVNPIYELISQIQANQVHPLRHLLTTSLYHIPRKKSTEVEEPAYLKLYEPVNKNLLKSNEELSGEKEINLVNKVVRDLLICGDKAEQYMRGSAIKKLDYSLLLDNYVPSTGASRSSNLRLKHTHSIRSRKTMSLRKHRQSGSFDLPKVFHKYDLFKPMNEMWKAYINELLKDKRGSKVAQCLLTADLHGAILLVADSKVAGFTGVFGIMIRETAQTFGIITEDDTFRVVPKRGAIFILRADHWKTTLIGEKFLPRSLRELRTA